MASQAWPEGTFPNDRVDAFYYPNLVKMVEVSVLGQKVWASNDFGGACHEMRHFIDKRFAEYLGLTNFVAPIPNCTTLTGTRTSGERVVGMLPERLSVTVKVNDADRHDGLELLCDHVLVVDALPVPFHISAKALDATPLAKDSVPKRTFLKKFGVIDFRDDPKLDESRVPTRYRQHPYWTQRSSGVSYIGVSENMDALHTALFHARGNDDIKILPYVHSSSSESCDLPSRAPRDGGSIGIVSAL